MVGRTSVARSSSIIPNAIVLVVVSFVFVSPITLAADQVPADSDFVAKAEQASNLEVVAARTALKESRNLRLRQIAEALTLDGAAANRRLSTMAVEKGWPSPTLGEPDGSSDYSDHNFVVGQIQAHQVAIALYREEATTGADTDLQEFARDTLRTLRRRLLALQSLQSS